MFRSTEHKKLNQLYSWKGKKPEGQSLIRGTGPPSHQKPQCDIAREISPGAPKPSLDKIGGQAGCPRRAQADQQPRVIGSS